MRNCATIAQDLLRSWLTYLYNFNIHLVEEIFLGQKNYFPVSLIAMDIRRTIHILRISALKLIACVVIAVHFLKG